MEGVLVRYPNVKHSWLMFAMFVNLDLYCMKIHVWFLRLLTLLLMMFLQKEMESIQVKLITTIHKETKLKYA